MCVEVRFWFRFWRQRIAQWSYFARLRVCSRTGGRHKHWCGTNTPHFSKVNDKPWCPRLLATRARAFCGGRVLNACFERISAHSLCKLQIGPALWHCTVHRHECGRYALFWRLGVAVRLCVAVEPVRVSDLRGRVRCCVQAQYSVRQKEPSATIHARHVHLATVIDVLLIQALLVASVLRS